MSLSTGININSILEKEKDRLFKKIHGAVNGNPVIYYSDGKAWKRFLDSPDTHTKNFTQLIEIIINNFETDEIRRGEPWIWLFDMKEQSIINSTFLDSTPKIAKYFMKRWENSLTSFYMIRPSTTTKIILKIIENILPPERLSNLYKVNGGILEIYSRLDRMGRSIEEKNMLHSLLISP